MIRPLLALLLAASGCADAGPDRVPAAAVPPAPDATVAAGSAPSAAPAPPAAPAGETARLAVEGEGLRVFLVPSGTARPVPFGTPADAALATLRAVQGRPPAEQGENLDCRAGFAAWDDGLTVWLARDRFVGWSLRDGPVTTASGIGIGSTRAELESAYAARVAESSLGIEFSAGGLAGLLESPAPDARVTHLWAGETCIAR